MEERKLIKLGNSSFALSLPKDWINKSSLKKGDKVSIMPNSNGELIISPEFKKINGERKAVINIDGKDEMKLKREFTSDYINGSSIFEFVGEIDKKKKKAIKSIIGDYMSCEIIKEDGKNIIVKDFFNIEEMGVNNFIKRIDNNIIEMFDIVINAIEQNKITNKDMDEMIRIDDDINKFYFLNSRIMVVGLNNPSLANELKMNVKDLLNIWWFTFHLEHIGDNLKAIAYKIKTEKIDEPARKELLINLRDMLEVHKGGLRVFYDKESKEVHNVIEKSRKLLESCEKLSKDKTALFGVLSEKIKGMNDAVYQILKMTSYLRDKNDSKQL